MILEETLKELESLGSARMRALNTKHGARADQFGVRMGDLRALAKKIKADHVLAMELWETGNLDARLLAVLLMKPKKLTAAELERLVLSETFLQAADWLTAYVVKLHPDKETLRQKWMTAGTPPIAARAGWSLTAVRVKENPAGLDLSALLDRIGAEMGDAPPEPQWTMNFVLANIGIHHPELRGRALAIGEKLGVYRDYPVSKGCTSPFAPVWINALVSRQG